MSTCKNRFKLEVSTDLETLNALNSCSVLPFTLMRYKKFFKLSFQGVK